MNIGVHAMLGESWTDIKIIGRNINNLRYADDTTLMAESEEEVKSLLNAKSLQLYPTLWDPMDCSLPGSSVHGIFQARINGVGCQSLLQGIFLTQESSSGFEVKKSKVWIAALP